MAEKRKANHMREYVDGNTVRKLRPDQEPDGKREKKVRRRWIIPSGEIRIRRFR